MCRGRSRLRACEATAGQHWRCAAAGCAVARGLVPGVLREVGESVLHEPDRSRQTCRTGQESRRGDDLMSGSFLADATGADGQAFAVTRTEARWYACYTRARAEKQVARFLLELGV